MGTKIKEDKPMTRKDEERMAKETLDLWNKKHKGTSKEYKGSVKDFLNEYKKRK